jgi:N-acetylneuraminic acid mutarotase
MAYIGEGKVLLFGGWEGSCDGETWLYDLSDSTWTNKAPATSPPARADHAMAYLGGDRVLLFGGLEDIWEPPLGDTWVYDLSDNTWTEQAPAAAPSAREWHAMAYLGRGQALMFGGFDYDGPNGETWVYDLSDNSWTEQASVAGPSPRYGHAMAALDGDQVLLFGGEPPGVGLSVETWLASGFGVPPFRVYLPLVLK